MIAISESALKIFEKHLSMVLVLTGMCVFLVFGVIFAITPERLGLLEFGVFAVTALAIALIVRREFLAPPALARRRAFREAFEEARGLAACSDADGGKVLANAALRVRIGQGRARTIADALDGVCGEPRALVYRLLNEVARNGSGAEICAHEHNAYVISAEAFGGRGGFR